MIPACDAHKTAKSTAFQRIITFLLLIASFSSFSVKTQAQGFDSGLSNISDFLKFLPPIISSVYHTPPIPAPDEEVKVTACVGRIRFGDDFEYIDTITLFYSTDLGVSWDEIDMDQTDEKMGCKNGEAWEGYIPGFEYGAEIIYYIVARDSVGNVAMTLPPYVSMNNEWFESDDATVPHEYLYHMFDEKPDENQVESYMDIVAAWAGYDDDNFYFKYEFDSPVYEGSISPLNISAYLVVIINRSLKLPPKVIRGLANFDETKKVDTSAIEENRELILDFVSRLWVWAYMPLAEIAPPVPDIGKIPSITLAHIDPNASGCPLSSGAQLDSMGMEAIQCLTLNENGWEYELVDNYLYLTIDRNFIGDSGDDTINFMAGNLRVVGSDIMNPKVEMGDLSNSAAIVMKDYGYIVGGESMTEEPTEEGLEEEDSWDEDME